jgi:hypothetical protein
MSYCPKCKSKLWPDDDKYIKATGVCSYCVTCDSTPDKRFKKAYEESTIKSNKTIKCFVNCPKNIRGMCNALSDLRSCYDIQHSKEN